MLVHRGRGSGLVLALAALAAWTAFAPPSEAAPAPADSSFWARYNRLVDLLDSDTTAARRTVNAMLARDPSDALARWARSARLAPRDSAAAAARIAAAEAAAHDAGARFEAACARVPRDRERGWTNFERARALWCGDGRPGEAARAELLLLLRDTDVRAGAARERRYADAESLALAAGDTLAAAAVRLRAAAEVSNRSGAQALPALERLANELAARPPTAVHSDVLGWWASTLKNLGRLDASDSLYVESRRVALAAGVETLALRASLGLAGVWKSRGDVRDGLAEERRILARARETGNTLLQGLLLSSIGSSELALRHLEPAREALTAALALFERRGGNDDSRVTALDQLGGVEALSGRPDSAARRFDEALALARARGFRNREAFVLLHLAEFSLDRGRPEEALRWNDEAIRAARESGRRRAEQLGYSQGAQILTLLGRASEAADLAIRGAAMTREGEARNYGVAVGLAVNVLLEAGRAAEAAGLVDSLRAQLAAHPDSFTAATADRVEARVRLATGDAPGAVAALGRSLATLEALDAREEIAAVRLDLGSALLEAGRPAEAVRSIEQGLPWYEDVLAGSRSADDRISTQSRWQDAYVDLAAASVRAGEVGRALEVMDRCRARELRHAFGEHAPAAPAGAPPAVVRELAATRDALAEIQGKLVEQYTRPPARRERGLARWEERADSLRARLLELRRRAERLSTAAASTGGEPAPLSAAAAAARLGPGESLVAFFVGGRHALRFDLAPGDLRARELPWRAKELAAEADAWRREIAAGSGDGWRARAARLADTLLADVTPGSRLYVVADGALNAIPFEAMLVRGAGGARAPLLERCEIVYGRSVSTLLAGGQGRGERPRAWDAVALFGEPEVAPAPPGGAATARTRAAMELRPLPEARREARALAALFPRAHAYLGPRASEGAFRRELERASILHVAAHGFVDDRHPEFSSLVLAPGAPHEDGLVQAFELLDHRGAADLVTLSACESGLGRSTGGEGLLGLSRAFAVAGTRQCIVSLWKVDDAATADLMIDFYTCLKRGATPAAALREARLALAHGAPGASSGGARGVGVTSVSAARTHPSAWAAFVLQANRLR